MLSIKENLKKYKTAVDVYIDYPSLFDMDKNQLVALFLETANNGEHEMASAIRALMLLDNEKFK